jgi:hypothetical protein
MKNITTHAIANRLVMLIALTAGPAAHAATWDWVGQYGAAFNNSLHWIDRASGLNGLPAFSDDIVFRSSVVFNTGDYFTLGRMDGDALVMRGGLLSHMAPFATPSTLASLTFEGGILSNASGTPGHLVTQATNWSSGTFSGGINEVQAALTFSGQGSGGSNPLMDYLHTLQNKATMNWASGDIVVSGGSTIVNEGTFNLTSDGKIEYGRDPSGTLYNKATGRLAKGAGSASTINVLLVNEGEINVAPASQIDLASHASFLDGTRITGGGSVRVLVGAAFSGQFAAQHALELNNGVYTGAGALSAGDVRWSGGSFSNLPGEGSAMVIDSGATLRIEASGRGKSVDNHAVLTNRGRIEMEDNFSIRNSARLVVEGVGSALEARPAAAGLTIQGDAVLEMKADATLLNSSGQRLRVEAVVDGAGTFKANSGDIEYSNYANQFRDGVRFTGAGVNILRSRTGFDGQVHSTNLVLDSGGWIHGNMLLASGTLQWKDGVFAAAQSESNTATIASGASLLAIGNATKSISGYGGSGFILVNQGSLNWSGGDMVLGNNSSLINQGQMHVDGARQISENGIGNGCYLLNKTGGVIEKTGDGDFKIAVHAGNGPIVSSRVTNEVGAVLQIQQGSVTLSSAYGGWDNDGTVDLATGTRLSVIGQPLRNHGSLVGQGSFVASYLVNDGVIAPGHSAGTLRIENALYLNSGSVLDLEFGGPGNSDRIEVDGILTLDGILNIHALTGYIPHVGDSFALISANTVSGSFDQINFVGFGPGITLTTSWNSGTLNAAVQAVPETESWAMLLAGLGLLGWKMRRARAVECASMSYRMLQFLFIANWRVS